MKKAIIIARTTNVCTESNGLTKKESELECLRELARYKGFEVIKEFIQAKPLTEKNHEEIIAFLNNQPEEVAIIAYKPQRISRKFSDAVWFYTLRLEYNCLLIFKVTPSYVK